MNGSLKDLVDIQAFTMGLNKSIMSLGLILPVMAVDYGISMANMTIGGSMIASCAVRSIGEIVLYNVISSHQ